MVCHDGVRNKSMVRSRTWFCDLVSCGEHDEFISDREPGAALRINFRFTFAVVVSYVDVACIALIGIRIAVFMILYPESARSRRVENRNQSLLTENKGARELIFCRGFVVLVSYLSVNPTFRSRFLD